MAGDDSANADARIETLRRLDRDRPDDRWFLPLAAALLDVGFVDEAIKTVERGLVRDRESLAGWVILGRCHLAAGRLDDALRLLEKVATRDRENVVALRGLAEIRRRRGDRARAADYYRALLRLMPWDLEAQKGMAQVLSPGPEAARPEMPGPPPSSQPAAGMLAAALVPGARSGPGPVPAAGGAPGSGEPVSVVPAASDGRRPARGRRSSEAAASRPAGLAPPGSEATGEWRRLRPEPRAGRGVFEPPPADLDPPEPPRPGRRPRRLRARDRRQASRSIGRFMRWVAGVAGGGGAGAEEVD